MREDAALWFQFEDDGSAVMAAETLEELGYDPVVRDGSAVHIHLAGGDLTSALEIAQTHGGRLDATAPIVQGERQTMDSCYTDGIPIPAHLVNEDWIGDEERGIAPTTGELEP